MKRPKVQKVNEQAELVKTALSDPWMKCNFAQWTESFPMQYYTAYEIAIFWSASQLEGVAPRHKNLWKYNFHVFFENQIQISPIRSLSTSEQIKLENQQ